LGGIYDLTDAAVERFQKETFRKYQGLEFKTDVRNITNVIEGNWTKSIYVNDKISII
jgi:hypothetical protein